MQVFGSLKMKITPEIIYFNIVTNTAINLFPGKAKYSQEGSALTPLTFITISSVIIIVCMMFVLLRKSCHPRRSMISFWFLKISKDTLIMCHLNKINYLLNHLFKITPLKLCVFHLYASALLNVVKSHCCWIYMGKNDSSCTTQISKAL